MKAERVKARAGQAPACQRNVFTDAAEMFGELRNELPMAEVDLVKVRDLRGSLAAYLDALDRLLAVDKLLRSGTYVDEIELDKVSEGIRQ